MQKARLIEKIAELMEAKKLPLVADVRDELAEDIRIVIEPKSRTVDAALMMELLFRLTDLETRIPLNLNVLSQGVVPKVMGLGEVLNEWLAHRREVLVRRTKFRLEQIRHRLEVLDGYLIAYLNLDKVIRIIRTEDEPKPVLMKTFKLTDVQAEAILNMRLRSLRKLEEIRDPGRARHAVEGAEVAERAAEVRGQAVGRDRRPDPGGAGRPSVRTRRSASAARPSARRRSTTTRKSRPRWSSASRSPSSSPTRAGSARMKGHDDRQGDAHLQDRRQR